MAATRMTSKGQITLPKKVRDTLGLQPGDKVEVASCEHGYIIKKAASPSPFDKYVGFLKGERGRSTDEIVEELRSR